MQPPPSGITKLSWAVDTAAKRIEKNLGNRQESRGFRRNVQRLCLLLVGVWLIISTLVALHYLFPEASVKAQQAVLPQVLLKQFDRGWKPLKPTPWKLHGELGKLQDPEGGGIIRHAWEDALRKPLDRVPIDHRSVSCKRKEYREDKLPKTSVIMIFCNEPFETLMRSVHSVLNTSPSKVLHEIILVDDGSDAKHIREGGDDLLIEYLKLLPPKITLLRTGARTGIVNARLTGIKAASGDAFVILDSHVECQPGWLEALVEPIGRDPKAVVMPHIDGIDKDTYELRKGGVGCTLGIIWKLMEHAYEPNKYSPEDRLKASADGYVSSPTMAGGLFAANRKFFLSIGGYDDGMIGWGAENVEFAFRLWQCGGHLLCTECSRVYHMFGGGKYYKLTEHNSAVVNRMRTAAVWMDEFGDLVWKVNGRPPVERYVGNISSVLDVKRSRKCKDFRWYLRNVWPESEVQELPEDVPYNGPLRSALAIPHVDVGRGRPGPSLCMPTPFRGQIGTTLTACREDSPRFLYWRREGRLTPETNDETCLLSTNQWNWCYFVDVRRWIAEEIKHPINGESPRDLLKIFRDQLHKDAIRSAWPTELVLVRLKSPEGCVAAVKKNSADYEVAIRPCDEGEPGQVWLWGRYEIDPYWEKPRK